MPERCVCVELDPLIHYRSFRNTDPPALAEIWRTQPPERGLMQPMSANVFEELVLSKPYFDRDGLIVALDDDVPVGFVHAAFGPSEAEGGLSHQLGVTCLVMVKFSYQHRGIGAELLARSEAYLTSRGAQVLYAGAIRPLNGFYLGLYGGSELPGVLESNVQPHSLFKAHGYREIDRCVVLQLDLARFRGIVDRQQMQIRRRSTVQLIADPPTRSWWEACTLGGMERIQFNLLSRDGGPPLASAMFWTIQPLASHWGVHAAGLIDLLVDANHRRQGLATFLISDAIRQLRDRSISLIETQTMIHNTTAQGLYKKLGFEQVDQGVVYRKE
jgi:GNAT superfamily N-acetyltransferase